MVQAQVTVVIPWRPTPERLFAYGKIREFWATTPYRVVISDSDPGKPFNRAQARNRGVEKAGDGVVVICDADTVPDLAIVRRAVAKPVGVTWPFTEWREIPADWTGTVMDAPVLNRSSKASGGCWIMTPRQYWLLGGQDERCDSWGWEDRAFHSVAQTLAQCRNLPGVLYSYAHAADRNEATNLDVGKPIVCARGRPWLIRQILTQRGKNPDDPASRHWADGER